MGFKLQEIVPWGRNLEEYRKMFRLTDQELKLSILSCADGPASFNSELTEMGGSCVSIDPLYAFSALQIRNRIDETADEVYDQLCRNRDTYNWDDYQTPENLLQVRLSAMSEFLSDYESGKSDGRYQEGSLPDLSFLTEKFELVLCSHFLFTYSGHLSGTFHQEAIVQMLEKGRELRIFPVCSLDGSPSPRLPEVELFLQQQELEYRLELVDHEFQKGGNRMLRIFSN
ncbi:MAG: SAM-dependent methyltransferase [Bacteroidota bacterium]|nr:SAM-dependent methyltransferase [Bacteroidota bacterium]